MEPTAPDLQLVSEMMKHVPVPALYSGCCRTAVTTVVAISMVVFSLGVLLGKWQEEGWVLGVGDTPKDNPKCPEHPARASSWQRQAPKSKNVLGE